MVKSLFDTASAPVLSDNVGILIGIRDPGNERTAMKTNAICAKVSSEDISILY